MSRRDTLIIAVLVNAGLLMVLFATAVKSDRKKEEIAVTAPPKTEVAAIEPLEQMTLTPTLTLPVEEKVEPVKVAATPEPIALPKPVVEAVKKPETAVVKVTVKKGDFLEKIAKAHSTTISAIMKENNLSSTQLRIGQVLNVPTKESSLAKAPPSTPQAPPSATDYYVVKDGDNPWLIASKNHVRLEELLRINGLNEQSARRLRPGDRIKIR